MNSNEVGQDCPTVSVVIAVYNSEMSIAKCLQSLAEMTHPHYEVIVVDDGSTDRTRLVCNSFPWIRLLSVQNGGPSRARNIGVGKARGKYIAFTDGDCIVDPEWLGQLERPFGDPQVAGVGGDQISPDDESEKGRIIQEFMKTIGFITDYVKNVSVITQTDHNPTCNVMYRRSVLDETGGFDEDLWPGEDVDLDLRIRRQGHRLLYNPSAVVKHYRPNSYRAYARMMRRYGSAQAYLVRRYGKFRTIHRVPLLLCLCLLLTALLLVIAPYAWPLFLLLPLAPFCYFWLRSGHIMKSILFSYLLFVTVGSWNLGFLAGTRRNRPIR